jgi:hypothetical protein
VRRAGLDLLNDGVIRIKAIGIDLGDRLSHCCILTREGDVLLEGRLQSTPAAFRAQFASFPATLIAWRYELIRGG